MMTPGEWIALVSLGVSILGLLGSGVWLASKMNTKLGLIIPKVNETHNALVKHAQECDADRKTHDSQLVEHGQRIVRLEGGVS